MIEVVEFSPILNGQKKTLTYSNFRFDVLTFRSIWCETTFPMALKARFTLDVNLPYLNKIWSKESIRYHYWFPFCFKITASIHVGCITQSFLKIPCSSGSELTIYLQNLWRLCILETMAQPSKGPSANTLTLT